MLVSQRLEAVLQRINAVGSMSAIALAAEFGTSEDTVRRDLRELAGQGLCRRVYGGAVRNSPSSPRVADRATQNERRKRALAERLVQLIKPRQFVFFDAGSTNLAAAQCLPEGFRLTVATHDMAIAGVLSRRDDLELKVIGGRVDPNVGAALGVETTQTIGRLSPELLLLGASALDARAGLAVIQSEDAEMKRLLIERSGSVAIAMLSEKISASGPFNVAPASVIGDLVVEPDAPTDGLQAITALGVRVHFSAHLMKLGYSNDRRQNDLANDGINAVSLKTR
jgi:DeoR/GlpR family transcriptional regulator of sugar metabolism